MRKIGKSCLIAAALWVLLTGCSAQQGERLTGERTAAPAETEQETGLSDQKGEEPAKAVSSPYAGTWQDPEAPGCLIEIGCADGVNYEINITWGSGAQEGDAIWEAAGVYDDIWEGVYYLGTRHDVHVSGDGTPERTLVHEEATGLLYFEDDGALVWLDDFDHMGDGLRFSKK